MKKADHTKRGDVMSSAMTWADVDNWIAEQKHIAFYFGTKDVLAIRPDLTEDQAWEVLQQCNLDDYEGGCPIYYNVEAIAERLFGPEQQDDEDDDDEQWLKDLQDLDLVEEDVQP
jgi:hypothetical protein